MSTTCESRGALATEAEIAGRQFRWVAAESRLFAIRAARALLRVERRGTHTAAGCASVAEFAELNGVSGDEARRLVDLGRGLEAYAELEADVRAGLVPVGSGAILGEISQCSEVVRQAEDWMALARTKPTRDLRRTFLRIRAEVRVGGPVEPVVAYVTPEVRTDMGRARDLVCRRLHEVVTLGEALGVVVDEWLDDHDPLRGEEGERLVPDTSLHPDPDDRYVPAEVDRKVRRRRGDACMVRFCTQGIWVQKSHRVAHAHGGSREAYNLDLLCDLHHYFYEEGIIRISGPPDDPVITDAEGRPLDERWGVENPGDP